MFRYLIKRLLQMIPLLIIISVISFGVTKLAPGDFLSKMEMNPNVSAETIKKERERLGLDQPIHIQYLRWAGNFAKGDMGISFTYNAPVAAVIGQKLGNTLILGLAAMLFTWLIAIPLGIYSAVRQYSLGDKVASIFSFVSLGIPDFFLALLLLYFASRTGIFPIGGMMSPQSFTFPWYQQALDLLYHLIVPTIAVGIGSIAILQRRMRGNMLDVLGEEYIRTARAKGLPENKVIYKHAVRNAINPMVTLLGYDLAALLSGFALVENVVGWPGLGQLMLQAMVGMDMTLSMAGLMIGATMLIVGNLLADLLLAAVDPRIKLEA
ncbi:ABC transporter permease [bacterium]|nr:ABC transporter permease [bacterium]